MDCSTNGAMLQWLPNLKSRNMHAHSSGGPFATRLTLMPGLQ